MMRKMLRSQAAVPAYQRDVQIKIVSIVADVQKGTYLVAGSKGAKLLQQ